MIELLRTEFPGKALVVCHSEPFCRKLAKLVGGLALLASTRAAGYVELVTAARIIVTTSVVRSSLTIPGLTLVFDLQIRYSELDFASQGVSALMVIKVTDDEIKQLKGRLGRTGPGRYYAVKHEVTYHPNPGLICARSTKIAAAVLRGLPLSELPQSVCVASLAAEQVTIRLAEARFGAAVEEFVPFHVTCARMMPGNWGPYAMLGGCEMSGLFGRAMGLEKSAEEVEVRAYEAVVALRNCDATEYLHRLEPAFLALEQVPSYGTTVRLLRKWITGGEGQVAPDGRRFDPTGDAQALPGYLSVFFWRSLASRRGNTYYGVFRDFTTPHRPGDPELAVLIGLGFNGEVLRYATAFPMPEEEVLWIQRVVEESTIVLDTPIAGEQEFDDLADGWLDDDPLAKAAASLQGLRFDVVNGDRKGRSAMRLQLSLRHDARAHVAKPADLLGLMMRLRSMIDASCHVEPQWSTTGCPMSGAWSFVLLNSINDTVDELAREQSRELENPPEALMPKSSYGYGDDGILAGPECYIRCALRLRDVFHLPLNNYATGVFHSSLAQPGRQHLAVFCEVLYDLRTGRRVNPPKPKSLVALAVARAPERFAARHTTYVNDLSAVLNAIRRDAPEYLRALPVASPREEKAVRTTHPRTLLRSAFSRSLVLGERVLHPDDARRLIGELETFILPAAPATRGEPVRMLVTHSRPPLIGADAARVLMRSADLSWRPTTSTVDDFIIKSRRDQDAPPVVTADEWMEFGFSAQFLRQRMVAVDSEEGEIA